MVDVAVIGAGLAGLTCARELHAANLSVLVLESSDAVGGRVRTDAADGFLLDRGFQVLLTAYPEAMRHLDYAKLELRPFASGALVRRGHRFHRLVDPFRDPKHALAAAIDPLIGFKDKLAVARLRSRVVKSTDEALFSGDQTDTLRDLAEAGFSSRAVERFFRPFFGGVLLDLDLRASSRLFQFLFRMFAVGQAAVPAGGMQRIPEQLAASLPSIRILTGTVARRVIKTGAQKYTVETRASGGTQIDSIDVRAVVVATDADDARELFKDYPAFARQTTAAWNGTSCFYYAAERAPVDGPWLLLNGEGWAKGPVNHGCFISNVSKSYAPAGAHLFCANVVGPVPMEESQRAHLEQQVRQHLRSWFGTLVQRWELVGGYFIPRAVPLQRHAEWEQGPVALREAIPTRNRRDETVEIFICGDYCETSSIQGALVSGRRTAEAVLNTLGA
jgi:phytoene dehydrogenase-like protein